MTLRLVLRGLANGKARFLCAAAGIGISVAAIVFTTSLASTNAAQAPLLAAKATAPWKAFRVSVPLDSPFAPRDSARRQNPEGRGPRPDALAARRTSHEARGTRHEARGTRHEAPGERSELVSMTIDYRPGGHVLQGPPMRAVVTKAPRENPYAALTLVDGRWPNDTAGEKEIVCVKKSMRRFGASAPALGEELKFVGRNGTMTAKIVGYLDGELKIPSEFPSVFANKTAFDALAAEEHGAIEFFREVPETDDAAAGEILTPQSERIVNSYKGDEQRRMDYATPLMLAAAILTALSLLVNSLLLSIEANRSTLASLRMIGMTRCGVVGFVAVEALLAGFAGWLFGVLAAVGCLFAYVAADAAAFPAGVALDCANIATTLAVLPVIIILAILFALRPALKVRPMDSLSLTPRPRRKGMVITFALGFAAFVAVEVWGASLMRGFVPSEEWPDAIVSILPSGVSAFDVEKLQGIEGVKRISELLPLQVALYDENAESAAPEPSRQEKPPAGGRPQRPRSMPNALFLAADWLPEFKFIEGDHESAVAGIAQGGVVIERMVSNARNLHVGDNLLLSLGTKPDALGTKHEARSTSLPIVGVVDLNWHMVTSRGLVRGLNRMPGMTDGPVFASFDTVESLDMRPAFMVKMTHLWVEYEDGFAEKCGGVFPAGRRIEAEIARRLGNPVTATVRLHARDEIADGTLAHGSDIIGAAARVPFVFLFILAIGFIAMLVAETEAKKREFAALRSIGATRCQLAARLAGAAVKTAVWGMAIAVPLGAATGWLFSINTASMWPGMPHWFVVPWRIIAEGALGALAFALIFAIPTSMSLISRLTKRS